MSGSAAETNYLNHQKGWKSWLITLDHKRIGLLYLASTLVFFLMGGVFALILRTELWSPNKIFLTADKYNQAFTYHGTIMVFMVILPLIPSALGNILLPMQLGTKDVAFPRLNLLSYYVYMLGAILALLTLFFSGLDTGWTFYTPYSIRTGTSTILVLAGAFVMGFAAILTALNFIVTVHKLRAPGLTWGRLPLFIWCLYATNIIQMLATPVIALTLFLLAMERVLGIGIFDAALGGDPVLFQHFFWFYSHPAVYIMILPAMGIINEVIPVFSRKNMFGYWGMAVAVFGIAIVSFVVWGHHMFTSGQSTTANFIFSLLTMFVAVPTGIKVFGWVATMYKGSITFETPMLYALSFLFVFLVGGLTGMFLATLATDVHLADTYFVVAHFHYTMVGGAVMAFLAGLHYWFPKFSGKMYSELPAQIACLIVFIGFNVTFMPQFLMGARGLPRRYYDYPPEFTTLHQISTVGAYIIAIGVAMTFWVLIYAIFKGKKASSNPWNAITLEWQTTSPPYHENFEVEPVVTTGPYDFHLLEKGD
ncbi:MAG: cytochrome c oxidase subunit I [Zetaproteobacteria bacterium]|nr:cytochrome c oxidase subunit I [Pseudobdellovibrionaceae bacterium]